MVYHSGLHPTGPGAGCLWAFSYAAIAATLGRRVVEVVEDVLEGRLEPLDLGELADARERGLELVVPRASRPTRAEDLRVVEVCGPAGPYGLSTLWGLGYRDVALAAGLSPGRVKSTRREGAWEPASLASILDYVARARAPRRCS